jgi:hypothetical protein
LTTVAFATSLSARRFFAAGTFFAAFFKDALSKSLLIKFLGEPPTSFSAG